MIKDFDNAVILSVDVFKDEKDTIKDGDILVWNPQQKRWELCKNSLNFIGTVFGVVCDTADGETKRKICIEGIVEANVAAANKDPNSLCAFSSSTNGFIFSFRSDTSPNAYLLKYLPTKYGKTRGLVKIWTNHNNPITQN